VNTDPNNPNPFAPSQVVSEPDAVPEDDDPLIWCEGRQVITSLDGKFPERCVYCNGEGIHKRRVKKYPITLYGLKKMKLAYWVCGRHARLGRLRALAIVLAVGGLVISQKIGLFDGALLYVIGLLALSFYIGALVSAPSLQAHYLRGNVQSITGCGKRFLESLPTKTDSDSFR
jgi:hypothetical protein